MMGGHPAFTVGFDDVAVDDADGCRRPSNCAAWPTPLWRFTVWTLSVWARR